MPRSKLPPRLWRRQDGSWIILDSGKQKRTGEADRERAEIALAQYLLKRARRKVPTPRDVRIVLRACLRRASERARAKGRVFSITEENLLDLYLNNSGCCAVTGLAFQPQHLGDSRCNPYAISLDRIDSKKGYELDNVRLVLAFFNAAMADYGEAVFREIVAAMMRQSAGRAVDVLEEFRGNRQVIPKLKSV